MLRSRREPRACSVSLAAQRSTSLAGVLEGMRADMDASAIILIPWAKPHVCVANLDVPAKP